MFSTRLLLELSHSSAAKNIAVTAVQKHMRILKGQIDADTVETCAPSEPMLAIAATSILTKNEQTYRQAIEHLIKKLVVEGQVLPRGLQGELFARILLILAMDSWSVRNPQRSQVPRSLPQLSRSRFVLQTIGLDEYLTSLLGEDLGQDVKKPQDTLRKEILEWAKPYKLNFTHFYQAKRPITKVTMPFLIECWKRGVAIVCTFGQLVIDLFLVGYSGSLNQEYDVTKFVLIPFQIKMKTESVPLSLITHLTCPIIEHDGTLLKPRHLAILMELGTSAAFKGAGKCRLGKEKAVRAKQRQRSGAEEDEMDNDTERFGSWDAYLDNDQEPERFFISVRGHSEEQFPAMKHLAPSLATLWDQFKPSLPPAFAASKEQMDRSMDPEALQDHS